MVVLNHTSLLSSSPPPSLPPTYNERESHGTPRQPRETISEQRKLRQCSLQVFANQFNSVLLNDVLFLLHIGAYYSPITIGLGPTFRLSVCLSVCLRS